MTQHRTEIKRRRYWWQAVCDCGWQGQKLKAKSHAQDDADEHVTIMARADA